MRTGDEVFYGAGTAANAAKIGGYFGVTATALASLPAGHVEILLGTGSSVVPAGLAATSPDATPSPSATASAGNGAAGSAVTVTANAKFGIPCVY